jgi:DUF971 family protein
VAAAGLWHSPTIMHADPKQSERTTPRRIHADRPARELQVEWADGHRSVYDFTALRWLCPCAFCRGEAGQPGWLDTNPTLDESQVTLSDIAMVGNYAVQPFWADGHSTGFYSFMHLRRECSCPEDRARRSSSPGDSITQPPTGHTHD